MSFNQIAYISAFMTVFFFLQISKYTHDSNAISGTYFQHMCSNMLRTHNDIDIMLPWTWELQKYGVLSTRLYVVIYLWQKQQRWDNKRNTGVLLSFFMCMREIIITTFPQFVGFLWMPPKHVCRIHVMLRSLSMGSKHNMKKYFYIKACRCSVRVLTHPFSMVWILCWW